MNGFKEMKQMEKENYTVDFKNVKDSYDMHRIFKESMDFPYYYGHNLDALWDCLTDLLCYDIIIRILNFDILQQAAPEHSEKVYELMCELKHCYGDEFYDTVHIFIDRNGVTEEIK